MFKITSSGPLTSTWKYRAFCSLGRALIPGTGSLSSRSVSCAIDMDYNVSNNYMWLLQFNPTNWIIYGNRVSTRSYSHRYLTIPIYLL